MMPSSESSSGVTLTLVDRYSLHSPLLSNTTHDIITISPILIMKHKFGQRLNNTSHDQPSLAIHKNKLNYEPMFDDIMTNH